MDVNYFGHVAMTKKFLPLLISKRDSRVVNICSAVSYLTLPGVSAYCASKYALESFSDCLRREMSYWGLRVSIIEPGFMRTPILEKVVPPFPDFWKSLSSDMQERWGEEFFKERHSEMEKNEIMKYAEDPIKVVRALQHAIMNVSPHIRYRPGFQSSFIFFPISMLPAGIADYLLGKLTKSRHIPASVEKQLQD
jgi:retinol dehydrogenase-16